MPVDLEIAPTTEDSALKSEHMTFSMGPHHPSTHGVLRLILETDGEVVVRCTPDLGYLHRSIEKIGECVPYTQFMPYTDRVDYLCSMNSNFAYAYAMEKLAGIEVPRRAHLIRMMFAELNRISSHMLCVGALAMDMGAYTPFLHAIVYREQVNDLFEATCGARLTYNYFCPGGLFFDLPEKLWVDAQLPDKRREIPFDQAVYEFCDMIAEKMHEFNRLITYNKIFIERLVHIGVVKADECVNWGLVGPNVRGAGVNWDLRKSDPYEIYDQLEFDVPLGENGDNYDRFLVRLEEMRQSVRIVRQCMEQMPGGPHRLELPMLLRPPAGDAYGHVEASKGELGFYLVSDGGISPYRCHVRSPSFINLSALKEMLIGWKVADLIVIFGSIDINMGEVDR